MKCQQIKANGERCKANAKKGESFCRVHLKSAPPKEDMTAIHTNKPKRIRFTGKGSYAIPNENVNFVKKGQIERVTHDTWIRLLEMKDCFEEV